MKLKLQLKTSSSSDSGFTIVESLMGIVVIAILLAATAPVLIMSTSIRVQSRRIEQATQAASTFINGTKTGSIKAPGEYNAANKIVLTAATASAPRTLAENLIDLTKMPVPTKKNDNDLYLFKKDGVVCHNSETGCTLDGTNAFDEFYIQARQLTVTGSQNDGYRLAIRVYRSDVDFSKPLLASIGDVKTVESPIVQGIGNRQAPSVERTIEIANRITSFEALCSRLGIAKDSADNDQDCR
jgi:prepilin-type N-terminal cleavage/methylation domain-containing protein